MKKIIYLLILMVFIVNITGCLVFSKNFDKVFDKTEIGMTESQVRQIAGNPNSIIEVYKDSEGKLIRETWSYQLKRPGFHRNVEWLYKFEDGKLVKFYRAKAEAEAERKQKRKERAYEQQKYIASYQKCNRIFRFSQKDYDRLGRYNFVCPYCGATIDDMDKAESRAHYDESQRNRLLDSLNPSVNCNTQCDGRGNCQTNCN